MISSDRRSICRGSQQSLYKSLVGIIGNGLSVEVVSMEKWSASEVLLSITKLVISDVCVHCGAWRHGGTSESRSLTHTLVHAAAPQQPEEEFFECDDGHEIINVVTFPCHLIMIVIIDYIV